MKMADVSPLYKSKDQNECTNYRPISLLLTISKLLEKIMYKRTYNFLEHTGQLYNSQYGFRTGHSCENAVSELLAEVNKKAYILYQCSWISLKQNTLNIRKSNMELHKDHV